MKIKKMKKARMCLFFLCVGVVVTACGQKGDLYLPDSQAEINVQIEILANG